MASMQNERGRANIPDKEGLYEVSSDDSESETSSRLSYENVLLGTESESGSVSDDGENIEPDDGPLRPYLFEPEPEVMELVHGMGNGEDDQDQAPDDTPLRTTNLDWCTCGNCQRMPTERECRCCKEVQRVAEKAMEEPETDYITITKDSRLFVSINMCFKWLGISTDSNMDTMHLKALSTKSGGILRTGN